MDAYSERRLEDLRRLRELGRRSAGKIAVVGSEGTPPRRLILDLSYNTAPSSAFPNMIQEQTRVEIDLSTRYPLEEPVVSIRTPIFHPNVYPGGRVCLGPRWFPTDGLDILVCRLIQIITFDPSILNEDSPANMSALEWYREARTRYPRAFPTDRFVLASQRAPKPMTWRELPTGRAERVVVRCPQCGQGHRVLAGRSGIIQCVGCQRDFEAHT
jgi:hypothetical protein